MGDMINDIIIIGGGDSGLLTGLCIQKLNPEIDVSIVDDFRQDIPQVGKSTFWAIREVLHQDLEINEERFVNEVKPVWKCTVYFKDWCDYSPFHYPFDEPVKFPSKNTSNAVEHYYYFYEELYDSPDHRTKNEEIVAQNKSPWYFDPNDFSYKKYEPIAYHLDTERFNSFLRDLCRERGISLINDKITDADTTDTRVDRVRSERQAYEADLYIDASGFNRVLKGDLDSEFTEFAFPLDSAFNARFDRSLDDIVPATVVESGEYGWFWQIDTFDNRDLGYVFASEFVDDDAALSEFLEYCDGAVSVDDVATYRFSSGFYERAWEENIIAIGNAEGFVEPLQSTGLTANAMAAAALSNLLSAHGRINDRGIRDTFNSWVRRSWESIRDFIAVHYKYAAGDNEFWEAMQSIPVSPRVEFLVREFDRNGFDTNVASPTENDADVEDLMIFDPQNFYTLMRNMGATSQFYETNEFTVSSSVKREWDEFYQTIQEDVENHFTTKELYNTL